jgi:hypothetical protein
LITFGGSGFEIYFKMMQHQPDVIHISLVSAFIHSKTIMPEVENYFENNVIPTFCGYVSVKGMPPQLLNAAS